MPTPSPTLAEFSRPRLYAVVKRERLSPKHVAYQRQKRRGHAGRNERHAVTDAVGDFLTGGLRPLAHVRLRRKSSSDLTASAIMHHRTLVRVAPRAGDEAPLPPDIMKTRFDLRHLLLFAALPFVAAQAAAAELKILAAPVLEPALAPLVAAFRNDTRSDAVLTVGGLGTMRQSSDKAGTADVVVAPTGQVRMLARRDALEAEAPRELGRVRLGVFVRDGARMPGVGTPDAFRQSLLAANSIVYDNTATGRQFASAVQTLGLTADLQMKTTRVADSDSVRDQVRRGSGDDIGIAPITEILPYAAKGLKLAGPVPAEVHEGTAYSAAVLKNSKAIAAAQAFLRYLSSPAAKAKLAAAGVQ